MGFFYNTDSNHFSFNGWGADLSFAYKFNRNFAIEFESGYFEFYEYREKTLFQIPILVSANYLIDLDNANNHTIELGAGVGVMLSNNVKKLDINWLAGVEFGYSYRLNDNLAINIENAWRVTVPVKYMDKSFENTTISSSILLGISYLF